VTRQTTSASQDVTNKLVASWQQVCCVVV